MLTGNAVNVILPARLLSTHGTLVAALAIRHDWSGKLF